MVKQLIGVACALLLMVSVASAGVLSDNDQAQGQFDGGVTFAVPGAAGFVGGAAGFQGGSGFSLSSGNGLANEAQDQDQGTYEFTSSQVGNNFAAVETATFQHQDSQSGALAGGAGSIQGQAIFVGAGGVTVGGQFGVAGSAGAAIGGSASGALGLAGASNQQYQDGASYYEQQSDGGNSYVYQYGHQNFGTAQESGALLVGVSGAASGVVQGGGSVALNDGNAGFMDGSATAAGEAWAVSGSLGIGGAQASAYGEQTHTYEQGAQSADGTNFQHQYGTVHTSVGAFSN